MARLRVSGTVTVAALVGGWLGAGGAYAAHSGVVRSHGDLT